jgi:hypothetical protein
MLYFVNILLYLCYLKFIFVSVMSVITQTGKFANCTTEIKIFRIFARLVFESAHLLSELECAVLHIIHSFEFSPKRDKVKLFITAVHVL